MDIISYILAGGGFAIVTILFVYVRYIDNLKEQVTKEATEKEKINANINSAVRKIDKVIKIHEEGIQNYYVLKSDVKVLQQGLSVLISRYNRDHASNDLKNINEIEKDHENKRG